MHAGIKLAGESITETYTAGITQMVSDTFTMDITVSQTQSCTSCAGNGTGLWQWVTKTSDGHGVSSYPYNTYCRCGELART